MHKLTPLSFLVPLFAASNAVALEGDRDPAFGQNGQVVIAKPEQNGGNNTQPTGDLDILEDGRFLWAAPLEDGSVWVGRAWRNGTPDATFGNDGSGRITLPGCGLKRNIRLINDGDRGAILWSGSCLRHILNDGEVEAGFGTGAMPAEGFFAADLARDSSGRFVLAGREALTTKVYRFDQNGSPDPSFGLSGSVDVAIPSTSGARTIDALVIRSDGRILVGGSRADSNRTNLVVAQLLSSGALDTGWGTDGLVDMVPATGVHVLTANALALDDDGTLVVAGRANNGRQSCCILLTRLDVSGQIVPDFGLHLYDLPGQVSISPSGEHRADIVILPNHRIIVSTTAVPAPLSPQHRTQYTLIRTFPDGRLDPAFGHDGWNSYTIADPDGIGQTGDYNQLHAIGNDVNDGSMVILGRTFFEDTEVEHDYVSLVRARFDLIFDGSFDSNNGQASAIDSSVDAE